ncbi:hydantoinase/oxoprolinase family protein [Mesorhizobium sp. DCY119]|nr:hydantoinase/oxoprolinase family protein [Mesorhizobium sp. DCY119]
MEDSTVDNQATRKLRIAVDIGGTFTDLAAFDESGKTLAFGKALSTYDDLVRGIADTMSEAGVDAGEGVLFLHGSTIVINNLLERTGARTALLITEGFRDIYEIGRINRPDAYNLHFKKHQPLVARADRFEIEERLLANGAVFKPLNEDQVRSVAKELKERRVEAVAVALLHSYRNAAHENRVKEILSEELPGVFVSVSSELSQEYREFERTSTVVANAYVGPRVQGYLGELESHLTDDGFKGRFFAVQSTGGLFPVSDARRMCVNMLESGPASGVIGVSAVAKHLDLKNAIAFDMGGTTAKAGLIRNGQPLTTSSAKIGAYGSDLPIQLPMIDIFEVGTGGGSIARVEAMNALRVGPRSAGSAPGPACYGRGGTEPTVTDANLVLGRLDPDHFLGGAMKLSHEAATEAIRQKIADPLGISIEGAAEGILQIAATTMSYAVKGVTTERGLDPGGFAMLVYGGAGPLHASAIARELSIGRVIIPYSPGHFSAYGMLFGDLRYDFVRSVFRTLDPTILGELEDAFLVLEEQGRSAVDNASAGELPVVLARSADMRYRGQEHAVTVDLPAELSFSRDADRIKAAFDAEHLQRYGTSAPREEAEIVSLRVTAYGRMLAPELKPRPLSDVPGDIVPSRVKPVHFGAAGWLQTPVHLRESLVPGAKLEGPALIEEHASTTVIWPGDALVIDAFGNIDITIGEI